MSDEPEHLLKLEHVALMVRDLPKRPQLGDVRPLREPSELPDFHTLGDEFLVEEATAFREFTARAVEFYHPVKGRQVRWVIECEGVAV